MTAHPQDVKPSTTSTTSTTTTTTTSSMTFDSSLSPPNEEKSPSFPLLTYPDALTSTLCALIQSDVTHGDSQPATPSSAMTVFHALEPPKISVHDYVARLSKYLFCSPACLITAIYYVSRVTHTHSNLTLTSLTVHRLLITGVVLACKYLDDMNYNLSYYAKVGGLPVNELSNLEVHMLRMLDFRMGISISQFKALEAGFVRRICLMVKAISSDSKCTNNDDKKIDPIVVAPLTQTAYDLLNNHQIPQSLLLPSTPLHPSASSTSVCSVLGNSNTSSVDINDISLSDLNTNNNQSDSTPVDIDIDIDDVINRTTMQMAALTFMTDPKINNNSNNNNNNNSNNKSHSPPSSPLSDSLSRNSSEEELPTPSDSNRTDVNRQLSSQSASSSSSSSTTISCDSSGNVNSRNFNNDDNNTSVKPKSSSNSFSTNKKLRSNEGNPSSRYNQSIAIVQASSLNGLWSRSTDEASFNKIDKSFFKTATTNTATSITPPSVREKDNPNVRPSSSSIGYKRSNTQRTNNNNSNNQGNADGNGLNNNGNVRVSYVRAPQPRRNVSQASSNQGNIYQQGATTTSWANAIRSRRGVPSMPQSQHDTNVESTNDSSRAFGQRFRHRSIPTKTR